MHEKMPQPWKVGVVLCLLACLANGLFAQGEGELTAKTRLFTSIGPGLRAVRRGPEGRTYVLASPSPGLIVFDKQGKQTLAIAEAGGGASDGKASRAGIAFGEDGDVDVDGRVYVADRGANAIQVFGPDGT